MEGDQEVRSLRRGLKALTLINQVEAMSIARLAEALELPRTTTERLLNTLAAEGYVARSASDKQYRLMPKVLGLSSGFSGESWITHTAAPLLNQATEEIGWPLAIAVAEGADMHVRYTTDTMTTLWLTRRRVGSSIPIPLASSGLVYLAFSPQAERAELEGVVKQTYPDLPLDAVRIQAAAVDGHAFPPQVTREQSLSVPIFLNGKLSAVLLMMFMARVHTRAAVLRNYLPRLLSLAQRIGQGADQQGQPPAAGQQAS